MAYFVAPVNYSLVAAVGNKREFFMIQPRQNLLPVYAKQGSDNFALNGTDAL